MRSLLRVVAVLSSLGLLIGCVWFSQKQARPTAMPGSKSGILTIPEPAQSAPPTPQMIMSGSKSFSGPMIKAEELQVQAGKPSAKP